MFSPKFPALEADWRDVLALHPRAVVFFWADWSQTDLLLSAVLSRVAPEFEAQISFFAADLDNEGVWPLAIDAALTTNPALVLFVFGKERARSIGYKDEAALRRQLLEWVALD